MSEAEVSARFFDKWELNVSTDTCTDESIWSVAMAT